MKKFESSDRTMLLDLLTQQMELFERIHVLCRKQTDLLSGEKLDKLGASLGEVQKLREEINGLHQKSEPLMQSYALLPDEQKDKDIEEIAVKMAEKIKLCADLNTENMEKIRTMIEGHSKKIDEQSSKRKGIDGYAQTVPSKPEMFDKKS